MDNHSWRSLRASPRVRVGTLCSEVVAEDEQLALVVDLSESGLRLERPLRSRSEGRIIQLAFEVPEIDEIIWAKGEICFDQLRRVSSQGVIGAVRHSGVRLVAAAGRHLRLLREYVRDTSEVIALADDELLDVAYA